MQTIQLPSSLLATITQGNLFLSSFHDNITLLSRHSVIPTNPPKKDVPMHVERVKPLSAVERKQWIMQCKQMRTQLAQLTHQTSGGNVGSIDLSSAAASSAQTQALMQEYARKKSAIRESAAIQIQSRYRGYRTRKPISTAPAIFSDRLELALKHLQQQRRVASRIVPYVNWSARQLLDEKKLIKTVLASEHASFARKHGKPPTKADKELYRPIYQLYHKINALIKSSGKSRGSAQPTSISELSYNRMKAEKRALQVKLNEYEKQFFQLKGRKIQYQQDIAPVSAEWARYKFLKAQLEKERTARHAPGTSSTTSTSTASSTSSSTTAATTTSPSSPALSPAPSPSSVQQPQQSTK